MAPLSGGCVACWKVTASSDLVNRLDDGPPPISAPWHSAKPGPSQCLKFDRSLEQFTNLFRRIDRVCIDPPHRFLPEFFRSCRSPAPVNRDCQQCQVFQLDSQSQTFLNFVVRIRARRLAAGHLAILQRFHPPSPSWMGYVRPIAFHAWLFLSRKKESHVLSLSLFPICFRCCIEEIRTKKQFSPTNKKYLFFCSPKLSKQNRKKQLLLL